MPGPEESARRTAESAPARAGEGCGLGELICSCLPRCSECLRAFPVERTSFHISCRSRSLAAVSGTASVRLLAITGALGAGAGEGTTAENAPRGPCFSIPWEPRPPPSSHPAPPDTRRELGAATSTPSHLPPPSLVPKAPLHQYTNPSHFNLHAASARGKKKTSFFFFFCLNLYLGSYLLILPLIP